MDPLDLQQEGIFQIPSGLYISSYSLNKFNEEKSLDLIIYMKKYNFHAIASDYASAIKIMELAALTINAKAIVDFKIKKEGNNYFFSGDCAFKKPKIKEDIEELITI